MKKMENIAIVLVEPVYPENIGATARACTNFGVKELIVVNPRKLDWDKMESMATRTGLKLLYSMKIYNSLEEALSSFNFVIGTTARTGGHRMVYKTLKEITPEIIALLENNRVALLFGNEKWGLTNEQLYYCNDVFTIPTVENSSLNVAQAVVVTLYEIFTTCTKPTLSKPPLASFQELEAMYEKIRETCEAINHVPHSNTTLWMTNIKRLLSKIPLTSKEARIITGFCQRLLYKLSEKSMPEMSGSGKDHSNS